tara:strand:- start:1327 stop:2067 length:741 start_codon:yes stop_codon:yes gene_type:complete
MKSFLPSLRALVTVILMGSLGFPLSVEAGLFGKSKERKALSAPQHNRTLGALFQPPSYDLPYTDWEYRRQSQRKSSFFMGNPDPSPQMLQLVTVIRDRAARISGFGLAYKFGGDHPTEGGMDCSGTMQFLLSDIGFEDMPRTSYHQYEWLKKNRTLQHSKSIPERMGGRKGLKPGDLIFWGGTYHSGHKVSHVMIYLGQDNDGTHYMFGARGKKKKGHFGSGVDIFELPSGYQKSLIGFGSLPGVA